MNHKRKRPRRMTRGFCGQRKSYVVPGFTRIGWGDDSPKNSARQCLQKDTNERIVEAWSE